MFELCLVFAILFLVLFFNDLWCSPPFFFHVHLSLWNIAYSRFSDVTKQSGPIFCNIFTDTSSSSNYLWNYLFPLHPVLIFVLRFNSVKFSIVIENFQVTTITHIGPLTSIRMQSLWTTEHLLELVAPWLLWTCKSNMQLEDQHNLAKLDTFLEDKVGPIRENVMIHIKDQSSLESETKLKWNS